MHHALPMCIVERFGHVRRDAQRVIHRKLMFPVQLLAKILPFHIRHHVEEERVRLTRIEQRKDVRMLKVGRRLDLGQEAFGAHNGSKFGLQDLQGDLALMFEVVGQIDRGHAAFA